MTAQQPSENRRILVIDDNESIHQDFRKVLAAVPERELALAAAEQALFGDAPAVRPLFEVDSAFQGQEGLAKTVAALAEQRAYALAFVDMRMPPGWDGVETIEHLWRVDPKLQIVVCTAYSDYSWQEMAERLELGDRLLILKKPFDNIEAYQLASALTAKWQMARNAETRIINLEEAVAQRTADLTEANAALEAQIHERRLLESQLVQKQKLESVGQLAAGLAHEINTPVQFVSDSARFVADSFNTLVRLIAAYRAATVELPAAQRALLQQAEHEADLDYVLERVPGALSRSTDGLAQIATIVRSMKDFARRDGAEMSELDLNLCIMSTLTIARAECTSVAELETDLHELPPMLGNAGELNQVILSIVVNAAQAIGVANAGTGRRGTISVRSWQDGDQVVVSIADTGPGVAPEIRHRIFDPFFTTKAVGHGTGQGLSIAYAVVQKHGGTLAVESELGHGTTFFVHLPIDGRGRVAP